MKSKKIPAAIGPYSESRLGDNLIYTSGQLPLNPLTGKLIEGDIYDQTKQSLMIISEILKENQSCLDRVIKFTVYTVDLSKFDEINAAFLDSLTEPYPARTVIQIGKLPMNGEIEIEAVAKVIEGEEKYGIS
ncbi:MAG: Rid family detoxifying hydrolase [Liquorilactobacillus ghanensis]|uniref:Rid family detoxifying hydrolase n=1 Tax=Liquorilactobacillus ghanensis TaxID=399370 RepID=UPI0039EB2228